MSRRTVAAALLVASFSMPAFSQEFWKQIVVPSAAEAAQRFETPPPESGMVLWWGMDGNVTEEVILRDLETIQKMGFTSVMMEAGYEMNTPYLSDSWFEKARLVAEHAKRRGMRMWVEDEGKYPSGFAGGRFSRERPDLRMRALVAETKFSVAGGDGVSRDLPENVVGAFAVNLADNSVLPLEIQGGKLAWNAPQGKWEVTVVTHEFRSSPTRSVNNPTRGKDPNHSLLDYLNPAATRQFLEWTHEGYKRFLAPEFGMTFLGFMGDEPDYSIRGIPWTPSIWDEFRKRKGYDVRPYAALFFAPKLSEEARRAKADYWDVWSDLFAENFFKVQADWCAANNVQYKVHLNHEDQLMQLVRSEGDYFKIMRHVHVPGVDTIWNQIWPDKVADFPKLASSAAHVYGKPRAFSESFAAYRTPPNVRQAKWVIDHQLARGINYLQVMFFPASVQGPRLPRGFMGDPEFPAVARATTRASYMLSLGRPAAQIGVYIPTTSMWLGNEESNQSLLNLMQKLLESQRDFDLLDEYALSTALVLEKGSFRSASGNQYRAVLVPGAEVMSKAALDRLRAFATSGGRVIFFGRKPSLVTAPTFLNAGAPGDLGWAMFLPDVQLSEDVLRVLPAPDVRLDAPAPVLKYAHRRYRDADLYFLFNEGEQPLKRKITLAGSGGLQFWDAMTGRITSLSSIDAGKGLVQAEIEFGPWESKLLMVGGGAAVR